jgi:S1-C subfamily serine protease
MTPWTLRRCSAASFIALALSLAGPGPAKAAESISDELLGRMTNVLAGRRVEPARGPRGPVEGFGAIARAVPLVVTPTGSGSAVVIDVNRKDSTALIVTNHHVIEDSFRDERGAPVVLLLFFEKAFQGERFTRERLARCNRVPSDNSDWCAALRRSRRKGVVLGSDRVRDLALLSVADVPADVEAIRTGSIEGLSPGVSVFVVGHPLGLLWSLTVGNVSAVRNQFLVGAPPDTARITIIQTQTPVNPGNSGGPLLTNDGRLGGVIFAMSLMPGARSRTQEENGESDIVVPAQGLNLAIGINEVQSFVARGRKSEGKQ